MEIEHIFINAIASITIGWILIAVVCVFLTMSFFAKYVMK